MRVIAVTGGKGGVGKSTISLNLAVAFAKQGKKIMLLDADLGLANIHVLLGLKAEKNLYDYFTGQCELKDICITGPHGIQVVPASSGIQKMAELNTVESADLIRSFSDITDDVDIMIVDMAAGISTQVIDFTQASQDILLVICNDPASLMDSYAVVKILYQKYGRDRFGVVVNKADNAKDAYAVYSKLQDVVSQFFTVNLNYLGHIPSDDFITISTRERVLVIDKYPFSEAAIAFRNLCNGINHWHLETPVVGGIQFFFERLIKSDISTEEMCKV